MAKRMFEKHRKGKKHDGHKPQDDQKHNKQNESKYTNFDDEPLS
ncbi:hypothetical protein ACFIJ5_12960 [Haloimpatiens sp. FM7330]